MSSIVTWDEQGLSGLSVQATVGQHLVFRMAYTAARWAHSFGGRHQIPNLSSGDNSNLMMASMLCKLMDKPAENLCRKRGVNMTGRPLNPNRP